MNNQKNTYHFDKIKFRRVLLIVVCVFNGIMAQAKCYYIDSQSGNDLNSGLIHKLAWKTLAKVNATTFQAGDSILFKSDGVWVGQLYPKGSGSAVSPITIDKYGVGSKPLIDGNGMIGTGVVYLFNQENWEINNLEIVNDGVTGADRRGVRIEVNNWGVVNHIYLKNLLIHNIKGLVGQERSNKRTSGIGFGIVSASSVESRFNDILIEKCVIHTCDNQGIITECVAGDGVQPRTAAWNRIRITNAIVRNNTIYNISKNAMIIRLFDKGVVENNVCYNTANGISGNTMFSAACDGTIFQYNEGYLNNSPDADGSMYDADLRSPNTVWQYSYSHDNSHGLFWTCTVQEDANIVCRYNISQNDKGIIFCINYPVTSVAVYNNTVYIPAHLSPTIISERNNGGAGSRTYEFKNNIIFNNSPTAKYILTNGYNRIVDYNCFYGNHPVNEPTDNHKITLNPSLVNPGGGGVGINNVSAYQLLNGSPCIDAGVVITNNGGKDYWGNSLYKGKPDIGAHEFSYSTGLKTIQNFDFSVSGGNANLKPEIKLSGDFQNKNLTINIVSPVGKTIYSKMFAATDSISLDDCPFMNQGIYVLSATVGHKTISKKLLIN